MSEGVLSVVDAIKQRHSVRTFKGKLSDERSQLVERLINEANQLTRPFGTNVEIGNFGPGIGRFGTISNEAGWLLAKIPKDTPADQMEKARIDVAFLLHNCLLNLVRNGIATVWIGGTFDAKPCEEKNPGFSVPVVIAYGEDSNQLRFLEKAMKFFAGSKSRIPLEKLFYDLDNQRPFTKENAGENLLLLECVQSGPSALNAQPWRLGITGNKAHLYNNSSRDMNQFDIGIALATITLLVQSQGHNPTITFEQNVPDIPLGGKYICTIAIRD